jgi:hypothetical protein
LKFQWKPSTHWRTWIEQVVNPFPA